MVVQAVCKLPVMDGLNEIMMLDQSINTQVNNVREIRNL